MSLQTLGHRAGIWSAAFLMGALGFGGSVPVQSAPAQDAAPAAAAPEMNPNAPARYTVRPGDTLWGIASMYLRDPWLWPEIWYVNPQVENPHLIYPGDVLVLAYGADGRPQLTVERAVAADSTRLSPQMRSEPLEGAIKTIPYEMIAAFLNRPMVLDKAQIKSTPHVVSSRDQHLASAVGNTIYVKNLQGEIGAHYSIVHMGEKLNDPNGRGFLGYEGIFTAEAKLVRNGEPATLEIVNAQRETYEGDLVFPTTVEMQLNFIPRAPKQPVDGHIIDLVNAVYMTGQYQAVVINRGSQDGLEPGHVLAINQTGPTVRDGRHGETNRVASSFSSKVKLPDERAGTLMIFKTFDRISYGLVMDSQAPIVEQYRVVNP